MTGESHFRHPVDFADHHYRRSLFLRRFAYAVPTTEAIDEILEFLAGDSVLEIGAGRALWAFLLQLAMAKVEATDRWTPMESGYESFKDNNHTYTHVRHVEARLAAELTAHPCLMAIWPPYANAMAVDALRVFRGDKVIYIGEIQGCTASDDFHRLLDTDWREKQVVAIPQWWGINDAIYFYVRK